MNIKSQQKGLYIVEFAIAAGVFFFMMFAAIEVARLMYTWSALDAMTQRGARIAAVCPMGDVDTVKDTAIFGGNVVPGVTAGDISVEYLQEDGVTPAGGISDARFVKVEIDDYQHQMIIPATVANFVASLLTAPPFTTLRPTESLGKNPGGDDFC